MSFSFTDLQSFREALFILQHQVDELDKLKISHYEEIIEHEEEVWDVVQGKVSSYTQAVSLPLLISISRSVWWSGQLWTFSTDSPPKRMYA